MSRVAVVALLTLAISWHLAPVVTKIRIPALTSNREFKNKPREHAATRDTRVGGAKSNAAADPLAGLVPITTAFCRTNPGSCTTDKTMQRAETGLGRMCPCVKSRGAPGGARFVFVHHASGRRSDRFVTHRTPQKAQRKSTDTVMVHIASRRGKNERPSSLTC